MHRAFAERGLERPGGVLFDGAARSKTCEQRAAAVRGRALQRQPRHERQIPARERAAEQRAAVKAAGFGEVFGLGPGKVRAVLIAQRAQQKQRIVPRAAGGVRTVARLAHAADEPLAVQPRQIRRGPAGHVFKRVGDQPCFIERERFLLRAVQAHEHDGGLAALRGAVELKACVGPAEDVDGGKLLRAALRGDSEHLRAQARAEQT